MDEKKIKSLTLQSCEGANYFELNEVLKRAEKYKMGIKHSIQWLNQELKHLNRSLGELEKNIEYLKGLKGKAK